MRYKLTDENGKTYGGCEWGPGVSHSAPGTGELCSDGWIHVYDSPCVAVMMNPCHADFENPRLWECEVSGNELNDHGLKRGVQKCMTVREIPMPVLTTEQRVEIVIQCALYDCKTRYFTSDNFIRWAEWWLDGTDRSAAAAWGAAKEAGWEASWEAAWGAAMETGWEASWEVTWRAISEAAALEAEANAAWSAAGDVCATTGWHAAACESALAACEAASEAVWTAAAKATWMVASNSVIDLAVVIDIVVGASETEKKAEETAWTAALEVSRKAGRKADRKKT